MISRGDAVVFVTGAGLSAASGIPTFRGKDGIWAKWVLEWGTRGSFLEDPRGWYNNFWIPAHVAATPGSVVEREYEPNNGHAALSQLAVAHANANVRVVTQNIDGLHTRSGFPADRLVQVHGCSGLFKCVTPGCRFAKTESICGASLELARAEGGAPGEGATTVVGELPRCPACNAPSLPQTLLFDEDY